MQTNHRSHLLGMLGIVGVALLVLLAAGRSFGEALPLAAVLACPLMMAAMMFMGRGGHHHHGGDRDAADRPSAHEPSTDAFTHRPQ